MYMASLMNRSARVDCDTLRQERYIGTAQLTVDRANLFICGNKRPSVRLTFRGCRTPRSFPPPRVRREKKELSTIVSRDRTSENRVRSNDPPSPCEIDRIYTIYPNWNSLSRTRRKERRNETTLTMRTIALAKLPVESADRNDCKNNLKTNEKLTPTGTGTAKELSGLGVP